MQKIYVLEGRGKKGREREREYERKEGKMKTFSSWEVWREK